MKKLSLLLLMGSFVLTACASEDGRPPANGKRPAGPPPEAFKACEGRADGALVHFPGRDGEPLEAICREHDGRLVAVPKNPPR